MSLAWSTRIWSAVVIMENWPTLMRAYSYYVKDRTDCDYCCDFDGRGVAEGAERTLYLGRRGHDQRSVQQPNG